MISDTARTWIESILQDPKRATAQISDEDTRHRLVMRGRKLAASLEHRRDTLRRIRSSVRQTVYLFVNIRLREIIIRLSSCP
jgi:hypothetical protein